MPIKTIHAYANCDETTIIWQATAPISGCRGFALERQIDGQAATSFVPTWVGFKNGNHQKGESQPSTVWPIQRYIWSDYGPPPGRKVRYRAIPMIGPAASLKQAASSEWSDWSDWVTLGTGQTDGFEAYFNRGIVPAQWLAREDPTKNSLQSDIDDPKSQNRIFLSGSLRVALLDLLAKAREDGTEIYAALYELNDPELIDALKAIGGKCYLILGSGAYKSANKKKGTPAEPDENAEVRKDLQTNSSVNVYDRLVKSPHFAHNKIVVFCDKDGKPATLWTGSTNWTVTGLCTQVNNGILIESADVAAAYLARWKKLKNAGNEYPAGLIQDGGNACDAKIGPVKITAWNDPCPKTVDLNDATKYIKAAKDGVLFLMFNPGDKMTLLNAILDLNSSKLFVQGVVNQDPGGKKAPLLQPIHKGMPLPPLPLKAILPRSLSNSGNWFSKEFQFNMVMIHSKVVVVDPFGKNPIVMTGSSNMGPKASGKNDDNLVIIQGASGLAAEYAVNIMGVYGHYKWLYNQSLKNQLGQAKAAKTAPQYDGNADDDQWQKGYLSPGPSQREIAFWLKGI